MNCVVKRVKGLLFPRRGSPLPKHEHVSPAPKSSGSSNCELSASRACKTADGKEVSKDRRARWRREYGVW